MTYFVFFLLPRLPAVITVSYMEAVVTHISYRTKLVLVFFFPFFLSPTF